MVWEIFKANLQLLYARSSAKKYLKLTFVNVSQIEVASEVAQLLKIFGRKKQFLLKSHCFKTNNL
jgi:hypothetical protein